MRALLLLGVLSVLTVACGSSRQRPNLPPPEYEEEPATGVTTAPSAPPKATVPDASAPLPR